MNLYRVTIEYVVCVVADNEQEARACAMEDLRAYGGSADTVLADAVTRIEDVPEKWRDVCPFGKTIGQITTRDFLEANRKESP